MADEHGLRIQRVWSSRFNDGRLKWQVTVNFVGEGIRPIGLAVRGRVPTNAGRGANVAVFVGEGLASRERRFFAFQDDFNGVEQSVPRIAGGM